jgi:hypothetical protein
MKRAAVKVASLERTEIFQVIFLQSPLTLTYLA